ncbi:hypothetical protein LIER_12099 [Lithospermum erythrorhizon]|uniref:Integrase zinc-binding domain-containing protein n=1 Tax=Lithospermum erythrorhizon TaxID=34254 RepID=A0AAV3PUT1_LITER
MFWNEDYDGTRNQILVMDPLPTLSRAFSVVTNVEKKNGHVKSGCFKLIGFSYWWPGSMDGIVGKMRPRLGHAHVNVMKQIQSLNKDQFSLHQHCSICPLTKQQRFSFPTSNMKTDNNFDLLHIDL